MINRSRRLEMFNTAWRKEVSRLALFWLIWPFWLSGPCDAVTPLPEDPTPRPNVLFICVDDWNDWVGCLGNRQAKTPNVDRLAKRGVLFTNAHCAAPVCNPSRVATLTGKRPDATGVYHNGQIMRKLAPNIVTLPQYFRAQGYHAAGCGKVFHDVPPHCHDPESWDDYFWWNEHGPRGGKHQGHWRSPYSILPDPQPVGRPTQLITPLTKRNFDWGPVDQPVEDWPDHQVTKWAADFLQQDHEKPFFLAVGIFRPHVPWFNPQEYFNRFPLDAIELPIVKADDVNDLGPVGRKLALDRTSKHEKVMEFEEWKSAVQAYLASIAFADDNVGRVLDALDSSAYRDNTVIVFWSDHGYHLGEKGHWHKMTLWERSTRVPLIFAGRGVSHAGATCPEAVNLLDLYPTLLKMCQLPARSDLDGLSLVPLLENPSADRTEPSVTTHLPGNHVVRDERWRYVRYSTGEEELYDHQTDPHEWDNLIDKPQYTNRVQQLRLHLPQTSEIRK